MNRIGSSTFPESKPLTLEDALDSDVPLMAIFDVPEEPLAEGKKGVFHDTIISVLDDITDIPQVASNSMLFTEEEREAYFFTLEVGDIISGTIDEDGVMQEVGFVIIRLDNPESNYIKLLRSGEGFYALERKSLLSDGSLILKRKNGRRYNEKLTVKLKEKPKFKQKISHGTGFRFVDYMAGGGKVDTSK